VAEALRLDAMLRTLIMTRRICVSMDSTAGGGPQVQAVPLCLCKGSPLLYFGVRITSAH
jgi:hypothetical protein